MPAKLLSIPSDVTKCALDMGRQIRTRRKSLGVSATTAAEAAGMSRVTWYRIEKGGSSVTMGAFLTALEVLDLEIKIGLPSTIEQNHDSDMSAVESIPVRIALAEYPQLKRLAWQIHGVETLTPREAMSIYERNRRHLDLETMELHERHLIDALQQVFAVEADDV